MHLQHRSHQKVRPSPLQEVLQRFRKHPRIPEKQMSSDDKLAILAIYSVIKIDMQINIPVFFQTIVFNNFFSTFPLKINNRVLYKVSYNK